VIIGVDEVNFSPSLAGDCVVVALVQKGRKVQGVRDSKQTTLKERLRLFARLQKECWYSIALASVNDIRNAGVYDARNLAISEALDSLLSRIIVYRQALKFYRWRNAMNRLDDIRIIIDGRLSAEIKEALARRIANACRIDGLIKADEIVYEVSAASIVAKVYVDALFAGFGAFWPGYGLEHDHGSPSAAHKNALRRLGPSPYHRTGVYGRAWWERILRR
jgi:ribonuclease HII